MRKRIGSLLLAVIMTAALLAVPVSAAPIQFADVADPNTALEIETLRLMGVLSGYSDGTFRPNTQLTRAQFCKMAVFAMDSKQELGLYQTVTVFPDVKPSHWASSYINLAAKGKGIISGFTDGKFHPERTVTVGQAVTILLRLLGYKDENIGGVWPDSYMAVGATAGLTDGLRVDGNTPLTRAQAARLFVNLLEAKNPEGGTLYALSEQTELASVDGGTGILKTVDGKSYQMVNPVSSTTLLGAQGYVVSHDGKALTFLPTSGSSTGGASVTAVAIYADGSSVGFSELAGNTNYRIYKNGSLATTADLKKHDVATYYPATNSILVCDTRVTAYYESCEPNPDTPTKIRVLNGTELYTLPTAYDSLSKFKPGEQMTLLLTADGKVAAAVESLGTNARSNALGVVAEDGTVQMLCGTTTIQLANAAEDALCGKVVRIAGTNKKEVRLTEQHNNVSGDLNISARKLGNKPLAESAMVFDSGKLVSLSQMTNNIIPEAQIKYARTNWAGQIDLIVLSRDTGETFGRVFWQEKEAIDSQGNVIYEEFLGIRYGNGTSDVVGPFNMTYPVQRGDYAAIKLNSGGTGYKSFIKLTKLQDVSENAWIGKGAVTFGGKTYEVYDDVLCYNLDSEEWVTLDKALAYADTANLYVKDGIVRVVEVRH